ncbi:hypothetical protein WR25_05051 [Diploscapter pachys]|uniref:Uncharacterized protein n=1 Tax=Diploscapter pachys TaxID=2018661 RepID=A0A2A2J585_9BILA|nr:hypothetical protein WR25_05051 [Diploscapter pachys]
MESASSLRFSLFDLIHRLIFPPESNCTSDTPSAPEFLSNLEPFQVVMISIASCLTLIILILALIHWFYVYNYVALEERRNKLYWLVTLFPVSTSCCLLSMLIPRASLIISALGILYFLVCLQILVSLCRHLFGGRTSFSDVLQIESRQIDFRSPPFCCLLPKLPRAAATEKNLRRLEWFVLQAPIVRSLILIVDIVAVTELREAAVPILRYADVAAVGSLMLAIFGVHTLARTTADKLSDYCFMTIFRLVDISLLFFSGQQPIIFQNILVRFNLIKCGPLLSSLENAAFVCNFVVICELFCLCLIASWLLSPRRNAMFDKLPIWHRTLPSLHETEQSILDAEYQN